MKTKLLKKLRKCILQNFQCNNFRWLSYYSVNYNGTKYESEIVSGINYFLTCKNWFIRKFIIEKIKKMREKSSPEFIFIKER